MHRATLLAATLFPPLAAAASWGGALGAASDYVFRGVSQSGGDASAQADVHCYGSSGWYVGLSAATVKVGRDGDLGAELNAYGGYRFALGGSWSGTLSFEHYDYPFSRPRTRYVYDELVGTVGFADRLFVTVAASPDTALASGYGDTARTAAFAYDLAGHWPLWSTVSANAGVGYRDLRRQVGDGYVYWNAGLAYDLQRVQLQLAYIGTDATAKRLFGDEAAQEWTVAALWHF
jgi:uncharacterized protein (TIGR02001 family)